MLPISLLCKSIICSIIWFCVTFSYKSVMSLGLSSTSLHRRNVDCSFSDKMFWHLWRAVLRIRKSMVSLRPLHNRYVAKLYFVQWTQELDFCGHKSLFQPYPVSPIMETAASQIITELFQSKFIIKTEQKHSVSTKKTELYCIFHFPLRNRNQNHQTKFKVTLLRTDFLTLYQDFWLKYLIHWTT